MLLTNEIAHQCSVNIAYGFSNEAPKNDAISSFHLKKTHFHFRNWQLSSGELTVDYFNKYQTAALLIKPFHENSLNLGRDIVHKTI